MAYSPALAASGWFPLSLVEAAMTPRDQKNERQPSPEARLRVMNPHAAGIDVHATVHWVAVPAADAPAPPPRPPAQPATACPFFRRLHGRPHHLGQLVDNLPGPDGRHGIDRHLLDPAVRVARGARLPSAAGRAAPGAACPGPAQERRARLPVATAAAQLRPAQRFVSARRADRGVAQLSAAAANVDPLFGPARAAHAESLGADEC